MEEFPRERNYIQTGKWESDLILLISCGHQVRGNAKYDHISIEEKNQGKELMIVV